MKKQLPLTLTILFIGICALTKAQGTLTPVWTKFESSSIGQKAEGWGVSVEGNGDIYWTYNSDNLSQGLDLYCHKLDANGNQIWITPFHYGGVGNQQNYVCNAKDTFLYIGGRHCPGLVNTCDMLLLKVDKGTGTLIWDKTLDFGQNGYDEVDGLEILPDGIYCGGWSQALEPNIYRIDIGLWKLDFNGNTIWTNSFGKTGTAEHQDGHFVVDENYIYAAGLWGGTGIANLYDGNAFLGKFSKADGSFVDSTLFGNQSSIFINAENALGMTSDGTYLYITGYTTPTANNWQMFTAKFDKNMNPLWYHHWGGSNTESARAIAVANGYVFVGGQTLSPEYSSSSQSDAVLLVYDTTGNFIAYKTWGIPSIDEAFQDIAIHNNSIYLSGTTGTNIGVGNTDSAFVIKVDMNDIITGLSIPELPENFTFYTYPNPFSLQTTLHTNRPLTNATLSIYNTFGQLVNQMNSISGQTINLQRDNLPAGLYFIHITQENKMICQKIIISD